MSIIKNVKSEVVRQLALWAAIVAGIYIAAYSADYAVYQQGPRIWFAERAPQLLTMGAAAPFLAILYYYWLHKRYLAKGKYMRYLCLLVVFVAIALAVNFLYPFIMLPYPGSKESVLRMLHAVMQTMGLADLPFILFYTAMRGTADMKKRKQTLELEQRRATALLLKKQLEPHFLFNTLNTAYAIALKEGAGKTLAGIEELAGLARYATETADKVRVPVAHELTATERYLYLRRMCAGGDDKTNMKHTLSWDREPAMISPTLLLPFAAHAFDSRAGSIVIDITQGVLQLDISENASSESDALKNANGRLQMEYRDNYRYTYTNEEGNSIIHLSIDLHKDAQVHAQTLAV